MSLLSFLSPCTAQANWEMLFYLGKSWTLDSDVHLKTSPSTNLTLQGIDWRDESFKGPLYYGYRLSYWGEGAPWGVALDFTHAKIYVTPEQVVHATGQRSGAPIDENVEVVKELDHLNFSHGFNFLTLNLMHRWELGEDFRAHAGLGAGITIPHIEATIAGETSNRYQFGGFAAQVLAGVSRGLSDRFSLFSEYKLGYADVAVSVGDKTKLRTAPWTHQVIIGPQFKF